VGGAQGEVEISNGSAFHWSIVEIPGLGGRRRTQRPLLACQLLVQVGK
jgi:hypothetical protein